MEFDLNVYRQSCPCGKPHILSVRDIWLEHGAINKLFTVLSEWKRPAIVSDGNTYKAVGELVGGIIRESGLPYNSVVLPPEGLHADEHGVALAEKRLRGAEDLLIAAGSGTIHDIVRYLASKRDIPFISVPTAASVDGFVSMVAAMTWDNCKKTFPAVAPLYVFADTDVFSAAPPRLTASGFSDLLGKYTALADWRIANLLTGEYYCERVAGLMRKAVKEAVGHPRDSERLMYGLLLSGLAMQMVGNSRPASGAEHHLSHFWEMEVQNGPLDALHGEKVGVGLLLCARKYHGLSTALKEGSLCPVDPSGRIKEEIMAGFPDAKMRTEIMTENSLDPLAELNGEEILNHRAEICHVLDEIPSPEELSVQLKEVKGKTRMEELGLDQEFEALSLRFSPYVRKRLTMMRLCKLLKP